jgi:hypothetical protein
MIHSSGFSLDGGGNSAAARSISPSSLSLGQGRRLCSALKEYSTPCSSRDTRTRERKRELGARANVVDSGAGGGGGGGGGKIGQMVFPLSGALFLLALAQTGRMAAKCLARRVERERGGRPPYHEGLNVATA